MVPPAIAIRNITDLGKEGRFIAMAPPGDGFRPVQILGRGAVKGNRLDGLPGTEFQNFAFPLGKFIQDAGIVRILLRIEMEADLMAQRDNFLKYSAVFGRSDRIERSGYEKIIGRPHAQ